MRPSIQLLEATLRDRIIAEAREVLATLGVEVQAPEALRLLGDHGAAVDLASRRARLPAALVDRALASAPASFRLFDANGVETHDLGGDRVYFTPGSSALSVLVDGAVRPPTTADYVRYARVMTGLEHVAAQSTAFIPAEVPAAMADSYRLYLSLLHCPKPVVTGAFGVAGVTVMRDLQLVVRGSDSGLRAKPLTVFSCCPTTPSRGARSARATCSTAAAPACRSRWWRCRWPVSRRRCRWSAP